MFDTSFDKLAEAAATPVDYVKLFSLFLMAYPLALLFPLLPPNGKHVYNISVTTFFLYGILGLKLGYLQLLVSCLSTYGITSFNIGQKNMPWLVFALQMGHLTINHLVRALGNIPLTTIEITAMQMVLCMNMTSYAWSVHDGKNRKEADCDEQQKSMRIVDTPSLLEFLGYAFYFPGVLIGPSTRFVDYRSWASGKLYGSEGTSPPSSRFRNSLLELGTGALYMAAWATLSSRYDYAFLVAPISDPRSAKTYGILGRIWYAQMAGLAARTKYYGIWTLTNGACILSGLSYNGPGRWDRCKNIKVRGIEFANNWKELLDCWNMNTNVWLRNNVYKRVARPGKKPGFKSTMMTFLTSAFWHGVAPGYYFTFVLGGLNQSLGRTLRSHLRPIFFENTRSPNPSITTVSKFTSGQVLYSLASIVAVQLTMNFTAMPFMLLEVKKSWHGWQTLYFYGILVVVLPMAAFRLGLGKTLDQATGVAEKKRKERSAKQTTTPAPSTGNLQIPDVDLVEKEAKKKGYEAQEKVQNHIDGLKKEL